MTQNKIAPAEATRPQSAQDERMAMFLEILSASGGETDASEGRKRRPIARPLETGCSGTPLDASGLLELKCGSFLGSVQTDTNVDEQ